MIIVFLNESFKQLAQQILINVIAKLIEQRLLLLANLALKKTEQILEDRKPINAFLSNLQTRIYSELSKQVTEQLFAETGVESGTFTLDGSTVIWGKLGDTITLTVYDVDGDVTTITIPVGSLSLPDAAANETDETTNTGAGN